MWSKYGHDTPHDGRERILRSPPCGNSSWHNSKYHDGSYMKGIQFKLSKDEVYYTILKILLVKIMLCSQLHCQKSLILKHISYKITTVT